jgi:hypothetical protein
MLEPSNQMVDDENDESDDFQPKLDRFTPLSFLLGSFLLP